MKKETRYVEIEIKYSRDWWLTTVVHTQSITKLATATFASLPLRLLQWWTIQPQRTKTSCLGTDHSLVMIMN
jgi:hypothetical protein